MRRTPLTTTPRRQQSMLDLLAVRPKFTWPACRAAAAVIDRSISAAGARPQELLLLSIDGTGRRKNGWTDTRPFYDAYRILCGPRNKVHRTFAWRGNAVMRVSMSVYLFLWHNNSEKAAGQIMADKLTSRQRCLACWQSHVYSYLFWFYSWYYYLLPCLTTGDACVWYVQLNCTYFLT